MARAIWSGSISFGLLNVPVRLFSAVSKQTVRFRELREGDGSRVKHKRVAESDGKEVPYEKIVKGYEYAPDQYVILTKDELSELDPKKTRAIEIQDFVDLDDIDPIYFEQPYYLGPDKGAERAYALLVQAMKDLYATEITVEELREEVGVDRDALIDEFIEDALDEYAAKEESFGEDPESQQPLMRQLERFVDNLV